MRWSNDQPRPDPHHPNNGLPTVDGSLHAINQQRVEGLGCAFEVQARWRVNDLRYELSVKEANWLLKATDTKDTYRPVLRYANLKTIDGYLWIATTDLFRLHMVKLGVSNIECNVIVDLRWIVHEAAYWGANQIFFNEKLSDAVLVKTTNKGEETWPVYSPWKIDDSCKFPDIERVIPSGNLITPQTLKVNPKYLTDAVCNNSVAIQLLTAPGDLKPILIQELVDGVYRRWQSVIMPAHQGGSR